VALTFRGFVGARVLGWVRGGGRRAGVALGAFYFLIAFSLVQRTGHLDSPSQATGISPIDVESFA
jgi:hypothetical protein